MSTDCSFLQKTDYLLSVRVRIYPQISDSKGGYTRRCIASSTCSSAHASVIGNGYLFSRDKDIDMLVVGPEDPLVEGIADFFSQNEQLKNVKLIGPSKRGALLEGSKERAKEFMLMHKIPTAAYESFTEESLEAGKSFLETLDAPYVLKADGLAAGKGVLILDNLEEAKAKVGKPHYWILNAIDKYEDEECEDIQIALIELGQLVFKTNYYSQKLTSENENEDAKKNLAGSLKNLDISIETIAEQMISMDTPKYARLEMSKEDASSLIASWV